ncbi:hypothetical protein [Flavobacterium chungnamense]|uniref:DUF2946 domain-containing protein n=1 Tax=Flavobacterium chungnamense TaxID=706182 RepID=A0ABP7V1C1_9FLAO
MKGKYSVVSLFFGLAILLAILLQSLHSYHHIEVALSEKHCNHKYAVNKTEISHSHHDSDHCFVCEFTFSTSIKSDFYTFNFKKVEIPVYYSYFYSREITQSFRGSLFALRAPPSFIV